MIDTHCHPQFAAYNQDRDEMIQRAIQAGVTMIAVGTSYESSSAAAELAKKYPGAIWAVAGIHPNNSAAHKHDPMETSKETGAEELNDRFYQLGRLPEVVAIGETGLDYYHLKPVPGDNHIAAIQQSQRENFKKHIQLARTLKKPLVIHSRGAYRDVFEILCDTTFQHGIVMHFFQGTAGQAAQFMEIGAYISFAGPITFSAEYDDVIKSVPLERIMIETDAPYAAPNPHRGQRNEPAFVNFVAKKIAEVKKIDYSQVVKITTQNANTLFSLQKIRTK